MKDFKTENHDKSNLVGDAKVMSDAVDVEQLALKQSDIIAELKKELTQSKGLRHSLMVENGNIKTYLADARKNIKTHCDDIKDIKEKSKAWDYLETLLKSDKDMVSLGFAKYESEPLVKYNGVFYGCSSIAEGVSRALESTKGES